MKKIIIVMVAVWAVAALPVQAQANDAEAKEAYKKGRALYKAGKYAEAVVELQRAYTLKPHPSLLRYMGDTYYKMNDARKAIDHYKKYLKAAPQAADKEKVEGKVRQLELVVGASDDEEEAAYWLGALLREANTRDVWLYVNPATIRRSWPTLVRYLGRSRRMWAWLMELPEPEWPPVEARGA